MPARLVPLMPGNTPPISLNRPVQLVGRHPECDVRLDRPQISRRHCCLAIIDQQVVLRDLGSRHGCWVNGRQVSEAQLDIDDEIAIGHLLFRLEQGLPGSVDSNHGFAPVDATPVPFSQPATPPPQTLPTKRPPAPQPGETVAKNGDDDPSRLPVDFGELNLGDVFRLREE